MQKTKHEDCQEAMKTHRGFPTAPTVHLIYKHCILIVISLVQRSRLAMMQGHQDGKSLAMRWHVLQWQNGLYLSCHSIYRFFAAAFA